LALFDVAKVILFTYYWEFRTKIFDFQKVL
jgi:hypothetical protein